MNGQRKRIDIGEFRPNLFILGAMKCGTSTLHGYLRRLPDVCMSDPKEPFFFEAEWERGIGFYQKKYFSHWTGEKCVGEARHRNLYLPFVPQRILQLNPSAKLIVILRDPVKRAFSHWYHKTYHQNESNGFRESLDLDLERIEKGKTYKSQDEMDEHVRCYHANGCAGDGPYRTYLDSGYYLEQIQRYEALFSREAIKVLFFEEMILSPQATMAEVIKFLGLDVSRNRFETPVRENISQPPEPPGWVSTVWHKSGLRLVLPRTLRDKVFYLGHRKLGEFSRPRMKERERRWLIDHYRDHNRRLADWLQRDLPGWES